MPKQKKKVLNRSLLVALGIPSVFFPGLILASILGWNWQTSLSNLANNGGYKQSLQIFPESAVVTEVMDGDTFKVDNGQTVRMIGVDAPDKGQVGYEQATNYLRDIIEGETVGLDYDYYQDDKYGRILAYVWEKCVSAEGCSNGRRMVNWVMVKNNYSKVVTYDDRRKLKYEDYLKSAEGAGAIAN